MDCAPETVAALRSWVGERLLEQLPTTPPLLVDDVRLIVSELVTNAVRAQGRSVTVRLRTDAELILVGVEDDAPGVPRRRHAQHTDVCGRGLAIVEMVALEWGVQPTTGGKLVWASFARP